MKIINQVKQERIINQVEEEKASAKVQKTTRERSNNFTRKNAPDSVMSKYWFSRMV